MIAATWFAFSANWCQQASWSAGSPCVPVYLASGKALLPLITFNFATGVLPSAGPENQWAETFGVQLATNRGHR
jgi:hypothetical protein